MNHDARTDEETILQEVPIFAHLAVDWSACGRTVPGLPDQEWQRLTAPLRFRQQQPQSPALAQDRSSETEQ